MTRTELAVALAGLVLKWWQGRRPKGHSGPSQDQEDTTRAVR